MKGGFKIHSLTNVNFESRKLLRLPISSLTSSVTDAPVTLLVIFGFRVHRAETEVIDFPV